MASLGTQQQGLFSLDAIPLRDLADLCTRVTESTIGAASMEDGAGRLARLLRSSFLDADGRSQIVLARVFQTTDISSLPPDLRAHLAERRDDGFGAQRCLALLGTDGDLPQWCDRHQSQGHQAIPLSNREGLAQMPMVSALVEHLGVGVDSFIDGSAHVERPDLEVFYIPEAAGDEAVPGQDFVAEHGVRSVLGFGGILPGGDVFSVILFTRTPVPDNVAQIFRTVAVAAKLALIREFEAPLFEGQRGRPADAAEVNLARLSAMEQMLLVQQQTVAAQAARLEAALHEALTSGARAEREAQANEALREITMLLSAELDLDRLVETATDAATRITGAEFGAFFRHAVGDRGEEYLLYTLSGAPRAAFEDFPAPRPTAVFAPTLLDANVVRSADISADPRYGRSAPHFGPPEGHLTVRSYLAVPVVSRSGDVLGGFFFGHPETGVFDERAERLAVGIAAQAAIALDNVRLYQAERQTALTLQRSLLPQHVRAPAGIDIAYQYVAGGGGLDVGGDWFDVIPLPGGRTAFVIGDVMGRGVHAAAIMGQLRTAIRAYAISDLQPEILVSQLSQLVQDLGDDLIATCSYAVLDQSLDRLTIASAGHLPPAMIGVDGQASLVERPLGPPLGVPGGIHVQHEIDFPQGSRMLLFTDGLVEHRGRSLTVGLETLRRHLSETSGTPDLVCQTLMELLLDESTQDDDVSMLLVANTGLDRHEEEVHEFEPTPRSAVQARRVVAHTLRAWGDAEHVDSVVMAVNELFINAVAHARSPIVLRLRRLPSVIVVEVEDSDGHMPTRRAPHPEAERHRGLHIVQALSSRWGARPTATGKVVWAEFTVAGARTGPA